MNKTLSLKDRKSLLNKYPVSESQLQYEFKRSKKKGVAIKEWLDRKYFPVHPPRILYHYSYAAHLRSILKHGVVFGDAVTSNDHIKGINAPSLTTKQKFITKNVKFVCYSIKNISNLKNAHYVFKESSRTLYDPIKLKFDDNFEEIENKISNLPGSILEIIFSDSYISFLWNENLGIDELEKIEKQLKNFSI